MVWAQRQRAGRRGGKLELFGESQTRERSSGGPRGRQCLLLDRGTPQLVAHVGASWDDEEAAAHMPADKERKKAEKDRAQQIEKVSKARQLITEDLHASGVSRPDPNRESANVRAARRARMAAA